MKRYFLLLICFLYSLLSYAQRGSIYPFQINEELLSGLNIPKLELKAHPEREYFQRRIYKGEELSVYILSSETALNEINDFPIDEFVYYLDGRADITTEKGAFLQFWAGDYLFVPKGFSGNWTNNGGPKYHLELSVISNQRADSTLVSTAQNPFLLDRSLLSGLGLTQVDSTHYRALIYDGVELEIWTESEETNTKEILSYPREEFIHVLNGKLTLTTENSVTIEFVQGDFFVLPQGFRGTWKAEGQNLLRLLKVVSK